MIQKISAREIAFQALMKIGQGTYLHHILDQERERKRLSSQDLRFVERLVKGVIERKTELDQKYQGFLKKKPGAQLTTLLQMGSYEILYLDSVPAPISVNEIIETAKKTGNPYLSGVINAVLRKVIKQYSTSEEYQSENSLKEIAKKYSHPEWIVSRFIEQFGMEETVQICKANNCQWKITLRTNTLKTTPEELCSHLGKEGCIVSPGKFQENMITLEKLPDQKSLLDLDAFRDGLFHIQDGSSALVPHLLNPQPGETYIDLCAAPGGKTCTLAELLGNQGKIIAVDISQKRAFLIQDLSRRLGVSMIDTQIADGRSFKPEEKVDGVLVDAPCSGSGVIGRKKDIRWNRQEADIEELQNLQLELLHSAAGMVREGGRLVYSTCSIDRDENDRVVEKFLLDHSEFKLLKLPKAIPTELQDGNYYRTLPHKHGISGAFGAVMMHK